MVLLSADDPMLFSSQNEQDNRYYGVLSGLPVLEPSTPGEAKEMTKYGLRPVRRAQVAGHPAHDHPHQPFPRRGRIRQAQEAQDQRRFQERPDEEGHRARGFKPVLHKKLLERYDAAQKIAESSPWNTVEGRGKLGIITNGVSPTRTSWTP